MEDTISSYLDSPSDITTEQLSVWFSEGDERVWNELSIISLSLFNLHSSPRKQCVQLMLNPWFERIILLLIVANAMFLAADDPLRKDSRNVFYYAEIAFNTAFSIEFCIKIICLDAFARPSGYFRDPWNRLDCFVLLVGWLSTVIEANSKFQIGNFSFIRAIRILKVFKTLNTVPGLKRLVKALFDAVPRLVGVSFLLIYVFVLFGIMGTQLYMGELRSRCFPLDVMETYGKSFEPDDRVCSQSPGRGRQCPADMPTCSLRYAGTGDYNANIDEFQNFDNILNTFLVVMVTMSVEGWSNTMHDLMDATGYVCVLFFVVLVFFGAYFLVNLVIAVIYNSYLDNVEGKDRKVCTTVEGEHSSLSPSFTPSNQFNHSSETSNLSYTPSVKNTKRYSTHRIKQPLQHTSLIVIASQSGLVPSTVVDFLQRDHRYLRVRSAVKVFVNSTPFYAFIVFVILFNIVILAMEANDLSDSLLEFVHVSNIVCTVVFVIELALRIVAVNIPNFFSGKFNIFDSIIVVISVVDISLQGESEVSILRTLRALRSLKLLSRWSSLQVLVDAVLKSGPGLGYFCVIMMLFLFVCALAGRSLFAGRLETQYLRANYDSLFMSFVTTFQILTAENWSDVLYGCMEYSRVVGGLYISLVYVFGNVIVINLFLAILLENFSEGRHRSGKMSYYEQLENQTEFQTVVNSMSTLKQWLWNNCGSFARRFLLPDAWAHSHVEADGTRNGCAVLESVPKPILLRASNWEDQYFEDDEYGHIALFLSDKKAVRSVLSDIALGQYKRGKKTFSDCFMGVELVDVLLDHGKATTIEDAVLIGQQMIVMSYIAVVDSIGVDIDNCGGSSTHGPHNPDTHSLIKQDEYFFLAEKQEMRRYNEANDEDSVVSRFRDDRSLYRFCGQTEQISEKILYSAMAISHLAELKKREKNKVISENLQGMSFGVLHSNNSFRRQCAYLVANTYFEALVVFVIVGSSVILAIDVPGTVMSDEAKTSFFIVDVAITTFFGLEMLIKMIALGVLSTPKAYFSSSWNILDFSVVFISVFSLCVGSLDLSFLRSIRVVRAVRPLRLLSRSPGMRAIISALYMVIPPVVNFSLVTSVFVAMYAILGSTLFKDRLFFCHARGDWHAWENYRYEFEFQYELDQGACHGYKINSDGYNATLHWSSVDSNFDDIGQSMLTLFELITMENWPNIMYPTMDMPVYRSDHPIKDRTKYSALFFISFIVVGAFFIRNLFIGILVHKFNKAGALEQKSVFLSRQQQNWLNSMKPALVVRPHQKPKKPSATSMCGLQLLAYRITESPSFCFVMDVVVFCNVVAICLQHFNQPELYGLILFTLEVAAVVAYSVEYILRILACTDMLRFCKRRENQFDFVILCAAVLDMSSIPLGMNVLFLRALRSGRLIRFVKRSRHMLVPLKTLMFSIPSLLNVGSLLCLVLFVFAVIGMNLFYDAERDGGAINEYNNFENFGSTMLLLLSCLTGEGWNAVMHSLLNQGFKLPALYFVLFQIICNFAMINMFVAVILENFNAALKSSPNKVQQENLDEFVLRWSDLNIELAEGDEDTLPAYAIVKLLCSLSHPMGIKSHPTSTLANGDRNERIQHRRFLLSFIRSLDLKVDSRRRVYFIDVVSALVQKVCSEKCDALFDQMTFRQRQELLYRMRACCNSVTVNKIETQLQCETFEHIDLTLEYNCATLIQATWLGYWQRAKTKVSTSRENNSSRNDIDVNVGVAENSYPFYSVARRLQRLIRHVSIHDATDIAELDLSEIHPYSEVLDDDSSPRYDVPSLSPSCRAMKSQNQYFFQDSAPIRPLQTSEIVSKNGVVATTSMNRGDPFHVSNHSPKNHIQSGKRHLQVGMHPGTPRCLDGKYGHANSRVRHHINDGVNS